LPDLTLLEGRDKIVVGFSGGMDSMVLLFSLHQLINKKKLASKLAAIHVNHGLHPESDQWQQFCQQQCATLSVPLICKSIDCRQLPGENLEACARRLRYQVFQSELSTGDCLVLGHHLNDRIETLLMHLNRGSGLKGLAGIPGHRALPLASGGESILVRPLLDVERKRIEEYAVANQLEWVDDDSNRDVSFDRNYLRQQVLPLMESRWPQFRGSWQKSLHLLNETNEILDDIARTDLASAAGGDERILLASPLLALTETRQRNALRFWLESLGITSPGWSLQHRLSKELLTAGSSTSLRLNNCTVYKYNDRLFVLAERPNPVVPTVEWELSAKSTLALPENGELIAKQGRVEAINHQETILAARVGPLIVRYRSYGESCQMAGRPTKKLKKLMQEANIVPWERARLPLLYCGDEIACIPGLGVCEKFKAGVGESGYVINWKAPDFLYPIARHNNSSN